MSMTKYFYDDQNVLAESDASNAIQIIYINEPQLFGNLIGTRAEGTMYFHHYDAIGATRALTDAGGNSTGDAWIYDAWGTIVARQGSADIALQWIGEFGYYSDLSVGIVVRARVYFALLARFASVDQLPSRNRSFFATQPYVYSSNRPVQLIDPSGLVPIPVPCAKKKVCVYDLTVWKRPDGKIECPVPPIQSDGKKILMCGVECKRDKDCKDPLVKTLKDKNGKAACTIEGKLQGCDVCPEGAYDIS